MENNIHIRIKVKGGNETESENKRVISDSFHIKEATICTFQGGKGGQHEKTTISIYIS